jgi:hypothetical protein
MSQHSFTTFVFHGGEVCAKGGAFAALLEQLTDKAHRRSINFSRPCCLCNCSPSVHTIANNGFLHGRNNALPGHNALYGTLYGQNNALYDIQYGRNNTLPGHNALYSTLYGRDDTLLGPNALCKEFQVQ